MIVTFNLVGKFPHMTESQMGAFVAHCFKMKNFHSVKVWRTVAEVSFNMGDYAQLIDSAKIQQQLEAEVEALANLEPFPCACGCGAFIAISPCLRQSGELVDQPQLNDEERRMAEAGNKIGAIKSLRDRVNIGEPRNPAGFLEPGNGSLGLKEAKDLVEAYMDHYAKQSF
jgi:hypothetical protein